MEYYLNRHPLKALPFRYITADGSIVYTWDLGKLNYTDTLYTRESGYSAPLMFTPFEFWFFFYYYFLFTIKWSGINGRAKGKVFFSYTRSDFNV